LLEGSVFSAGSAVQWLRDGLGIIEQASDIEALAASVPDSGGVVLVPAFTGLGSPWWDAHARGTIVGITRGTSRAHLARATLEAIALQSAELLTGMREDSGLPVNAMRADGGASANGLLMQLQADLLGMPVIVAAVPETTALGAARLAALGAGASPLQDADGRGERVYEPRASRDWADSRLSEWRRAVERSRAWVQD
jgi:glycerol kinase